MSAVATEQVEAASHMPLACCAAAEARRWGLAERGGAWALHSGLLLAELAPEALAARTFMHGRWRIEWQQHTVSDQCSCSAGQVQIALGSHGSEVAPGSWLW